MTTEADLRRAGYPPVRKADETIIIPRAEYEALRYAARILATERPGHPAIAALRAAGILEEK